MKLKCYIHCFNLLMIINLMRMIRDQNCKHGGEYEQMVFLEKNTTPRPPQWRFTRRCCIYIIPDHFSLFYHLILINLINLLLPSTSIVHSFLHYELKVNTQCLLLFAYLDGYFRLKTADLMR